MMILTTTSSLFNYNGTWVQELTQKFLQVFLETFFEVFLQKQLQGLIRNFFRNFYRDFSMVVSTLEMTSEISPEISLWISFGLSSGIFLEASLRFFISDSQKKNQNFFKEFSSDSSLVCLQWFLQLNNTGIYTKNFLEILQRTSLRILPLIPPQAIHEILIGMHPNISPWIPLEIFPEKPPVIPETSPVI